MESLPKGGEMDTGLLSGEVFRDEAAMEARVATFAVRTHGDRVSPELLERWAREAVAEIWGQGPIVTKYVPMLAMRKVNEYVREYIQTHARSHHADQAAGHSFFAAAAHPANHERSVRQGDEVVKPVAPAVHLPPIRAVKKPQQQRVREQTV
jgi:hypothetical protein